MRVDISKKNILGDGVTDYTVALQNIIDMLSGNGGGRIIFSCRNLSDRFIIHKK